MVGNHESPAPTTDFSQGARVNPNQDNILGRMCGSRGGQVVRTPPPEKAPKCRVCSQYWSGSPASSARQQNTNAISMAFRWRADDGPFILVTKLSRFIALTKLSRFIALTKLSRSAHGACFLIILNQRTCRAT